MRLPWSVLVVLSLGCSPKTCEETCAGCCDAAGECRPGATLTYCGTSGRKCDTCLSTDLCSPTGVCVSFGSTGGGSGAGGGRASGGGVASGGSGGGATEARVFVLLRYEWANCCLDFTCACSNCRLQQCSITREVGQSRFAALRTGSLSTCVITQTSGDGYTADCAGACFARDQMCLVNGNRYPDKFIDCPEIMGTSTFSCDWTPY